MPGTKRKSSHLSRGSQKTGKHGKRRGQGKCRTENLQVPDERRFPYAPFVIGGGILIALAFLFDTLLAPDGDPANFGMNSAVAAFFKSAGNVASALCYHPGRLYRHGYRRTGPALWWVRGRRSGNTGLCFQNGQFVDSSTAGASVVSAGFLGALIAGFLAGFPDEGAGKAVFQASGFAGRD